MNLPYFGYLVALLFFISCAPTKPPATSVKSYIDLKREYVSALESASPQWGVGSNYRLAVIPPMTEPYMPGTPLLAGSYEPLTDACMVPKDRMPPIDLSGPPETNYNSDFSVSLGVPALLKPAIEAVADVRAATSAQDIAAFALTQLKVINPRSDVLREATLSERCLSAIAQKDVVMVRGLIYGTEKISSKHSFSGNVTSASLGTNNIEVKYDSHGGYEVKDSQPKPLFWIVSNMHLHISGLDNNHLTPVQRLETIRTHLTEKREGIGIMEAAPSQQTIRGVETPNFFRRRLQW